jgi:hypothetical protein
MMMWYFGCGAEDAIFMTISLLAEWKIFNVIFFLAPAIALQWEIKSSSAAGVGVRGKGARKKK